MRTTHLRHYRAAGPAVSPACAAWAAGGGVACADPLDPLPQRRRAAPGQRSRANCGERHLCSAAAILLRARESL